jgi:hypothetical protein
MNAGTCLTPLETDYGTTFDYYKEICSCPPTWSGAYCGCSGTTQRDVILLIGNTNTVASQTNYNQVQFRVSHN